MARLEDDALDGAIDFILKEIDNNHPLFDEFERVNPANSNRLSNIYFKIQKNITLFYEYFLDVYKDKSEDWCLEEAIETCTRGMVSEYALNSTAISNHLDDRTFREAEDNVRNWSRDKEDYRRWESGGSSRNGRFSERGVRGGDTRQSRDYGGVSRSQSNSNPRTRQVSRERNEERVERPARENPRSRDTRPEPPPPRAVKSANSRYFTRIEELSYYPRRPGQMSLPYYDPMTQRLSAFLDNEGYIAFEILELKEMDADAHKRVLTTHVSPQLERQYKRAPTRPVEYVSRGIALDRTEVENKFVEDALAEHIKSNNLNPNTTFSQLKESEKDTILTEATRQFNQMHAQHYAKLRAEKINQASFGVEPMEIMKVKLKSLPVRPTDAINQVLMSYSDTLNQDSEGNVGYEVGYRSISLLHVFKDTVDCEIYKNLLVGLQRKQPNIMRIHASLKDGAIPTEILSILSTRINDLMEEGIRLILKLHPDFPRVDFIEHLEDFAAFLQGEIENGVIDQETFNSFCDYVATGAARLVDIDKSSLVDRLGVSELEAEKLTRTALFEVQNGSIYYVPHYAHVLGLMHNQPYTEVKREECRTVLKDICPADKVFKYDDLICTKDRKYYRVVYNNTKGFCLKPVCLS